MSDSESGVANGHRRLALTVPDLGSGSVTVRVGAWLVSDGETVSAGDRLIELIFPGVLFDVSAPCSGRIRGQRRFPGAIVVAGDTLGWVECEEIPGSPTADDLGEDSPGDDLTPENGAD